MTQENLINKEKKVERKPRTTTKTTKTTPTTTKTTRPPHDDWLLDVEFFQIVQSKAGEAPQLCLIPAPTIDIDQPVSMPDGEGTFHIATHVAGGRMADDCDAILEVRRIIRFRPPPNSIIRVI